MELSRKDTKMLQGLSALAMVCLHLFCTYNYTDKYTPVMFAGGGVPLCLYFAQLSDFCVFGFAFCSGYGHYVQWGKQGFYKNRLKGLLSVLCSYWMVLVVFSVIGITIGQGNFMPGSFDKFIRNVLTLESSYNGAHWYMFAYVLLIIASPVLMNFTQKFHPIGVLGFGFLIYCVAYYVRFQMPISNWFLVKFGPFGMTLFEYLVGAVCCRIRFVSFSYDAWKKIPRVVCWIMAPVILLALLYVRTKLIPSLFVAPISGMAIMLLFHFWEKPVFIQKMFLLIGEHAINIWLTHMFFYLNLFIGFVFVAKYPPMIYVFMIAITIAVSLVLKTLEKPLQKRISAI